MATILVIDDEASMRSLFQVALEGARYQVLTAENGKHGLRLLDHEAADLVFVDIFMPEMDGLQLIPLVRKMRPATKVIAMSGGSGLMDHLDTAKKLGAHDTLKKPFGLQELLDAVTAQLTDPSQESSPIPTSERSRVTPDVPPSCNGGAELVESVIKETSPLEKRKCPRFPVMLPVVFFGEQAGGGLVMDVSLEGCRIRSAVPMHKGTYIQIRMDLIGDTLTGDLAVVRWAAKEEFGVELIRMASDQQARLREFLNLFSTPTLDHPPPEH